MRIFNLEKIFSFALYPDGDKKRDRNSQKYYLTIDQYSKKDSDVVEGNIGSDQLARMNVICLGVVKKIFNTLNRDIGYKKFKTVEKGKHLIEKEFITPDSKVPFPFFLFYKKQAVDITPKLKLYSILKSFFREIIELHKKKMALLKGIDISKESVIEINKNNQSQVEKIAENVFKKIEESRPEINSIGIFIDPYFIRKKEGELLLEDTRPTDPAPRKNIYSTKKQDFLETGVKQELIESETNSINLKASIFIDKNNNKDISSSCDLTFLEYKKEISTISVLEKNTILVDTASRDEESDTHTIVDLAIHRQGKKVEVIIPEQGNNIYFAEHKSYEWNLEIKKEITTLLLDYQRHLKKNMFRSYNRQAKNKEFYVNELLLTLKKNTLENFIEHLSLKTLINSLGEHRDCSIITKIGFFFKGHNKTEGTLLLKNILSKLNENNTKVNTMSV